MSALTPDPNHYTILSAMLAPAFFLTATASLLMSANTRLARIIDRARTLMKELEVETDPSDREQLEALITLQRKRSRIILRGSQLLYAAISCFVGTSLSVAGDAFFGYRFGVMPTALAALGVLAMLASSLLLARESSLAVDAIDDELNHAHSRARKLRKTG